jgi:hypothetical protein
MKGLPQIACVAALVATTLHAGPPKREAAPLPDFWYVVPDESTADAESGLVRGIVIPSSVSPTVRTTPTGSVISWRRPDGTRQSFAVQGMSSFTFEPGPLVGTTYVPFSSRRRLQPETDSCCVCASWLNMVESLERLSCVLGCSGCGCEACICSATSGCPAPPPGVMTLVAHNDPTAKMTFHKTGATERIEIADRGRAAVSFHGRHVSATLNAHGETLIINPESVTLPGRVSSSESIRGEQALFAWSSEEASVILEQPRSMAAPLFEGGIIDFSTQLHVTPTTTAKWLEAEPVADMCRVCGTHPNSMSDLTIYDCVPGDSVCYRCISWGC